jgi:uncharacterized protein YjbI with pentapeptide repeats
MHTSNPGDRSMGNKEHLAILKKGMKTWNKWKRENLDILPNLQKAKLKNLDLSKFDFSLADPGHADLSLADLVHADYAWRKIFCK